MNMTGLEIVYDGEGLADVVFRREINEQSTWAQRVTNGIHLNDTCFWDAEIRDLKEQRKFSDEQGRGPSTMVNSRENRYEICSSEPSTRFDEKGEGKFYRKRKINKGSKNYPTKPKKRVIKKSKVTTLEEDDEWRSTEAYEPIYDDSPFSYQPFEVTNPGVHPQIRGRYEGPGYLSMSKSFISGLFGTAWYFPPVKWMYPRPDYLSIFLEIDYIQTNRRRDFDILEGKNARYVSDIWINDAKGGYGIKFYDDGDAAENMMEHMRWLQKEWLDARRAAM